jgi:hypothetical protein
MADAEREAAANRKAKATKVPKGTSQYQVRHFSARPAAYGASAGGLSRSPGTHRALCAGPWRRQCAYSPGVSAFPLRKLGALCCVPGGVAGRFGQRGRRRRGGE